MRSFGPLHGMKEMEHAPFLSHRKWEREMTGMESGQSHHFRRFWVAIGLSSGSGQRGGVCIHLGVPQSKGGKMRTLQYCFNFPINRLEKNPECSKRQKVHPKPCGFTHMNIQTDFSTDNHCEWFKQCWPPPWAVQKHLTVCVCRAANSCRNTSTIERELRHKHKSCLCVQTTFVRSRTCSWKGGAGVAAVRGLLVRAWLCKACLTLVESSNAQSQELRHESLLSMHGYI